MGKVKRTAVLLGLTAALLAPAGAAHAAVSCAYPATCPPETKIDEQVQATTVQAPAAAPAAAAARGTLPVTGSDAVTLVAMGAGALAVGAVLVRRTRRSD